MDMPVISDSISARTKYTSALEVSPSPWDAHISLGNDKETAVEYTRFPFPLWPKSLDFRASKTLWGKEPAWVKKKIRKIFFHQKKLVLHSIPVISAYISFPINEFCMFNPCPWHPDLAQSCLILVAKQGQAWLVLEWEINVYNIDLWDLKNLWTIKIEEGDATKY